MTRLIRVLVALGMLASPTAVWAQGSVAGNGGTGIGGNPTGGSGSGTITGVTAGTGLSGGGTSGSVTVNLATPVTAAHGGTGVDSSAATNGELLIGTGTGLALGTLTAGSNVTITNASGSITIAATAGGGGVSSVTNSDGTLTISPTTGAVVASLALGNANTWTAAQTFSGGILETGTTGYQIGTGNGLNILSTNTNTLVGYQANNAGAVANDTSVGYQALFVDASSGGNTAVGSGAGKELASASNVAVGSGACQYTSGTVGGANVCIGFNTLEGQLGTFNTGARSTAVGLGAGQFCAICTQETFIGDASFESVSGTPLTGQNNTGVGYKSGFGVDGAAASNTMLGALVGSAVCVAPANVLLIGDTAGTDCTSANETNTIHIGSGGGDIIYVTGTGTPATSVFTLGGNLTAAHLATAGTIAGSICATSAGVILYESAASSCTISLEELKKDIVPVSANAAIADVMALRPIAYEMKEQPGRRLGFGARQVHSVDPLLSTHDGNGNLQAFDPNGILAELVATVQAQQAKIAALEARSQP